jgi:hypothetical protein
MVHLILDEDVVEAGGGGTGYYAEVQTESKGRKKRTKVKIEAFTIAEFCAAHRISRATYYNLKKKNQGPAEAHVLGRIIVTRESAAAWRQACMAARRAPPRP